MLTVDDEQNTPVARSAAKGNGDRSDARHAASSGGWRRPWRLIPGPDNTKGRVVRSAVAIVLTISLIMAMQVGISVVGALRTPGNSSFKAKWADWLRDHNGNEVVNALETVYFTRDAPSKGGVPQHGVRRQAAPKAFPGQKPAVQVAAPTTIPHLPAPAPVKLATTTGVAGEGQWQPTGPLVGGQPAIYYTAVRPDAEYTSILVSLVYMDTKLLKVNLMPGSEEPSGQFLNPPVIAGPNLSKVVAGFNGGFRFKDGAGGFFLGGNQAVALQNGKASMVIYKDGRVNIGQWGRELQLTPDVEAVRQNLVLLVDGGQRVPNLNPDDTSIWGNTLNGRVLVPRSGICVDTNGALIYVAGPGLKITNLADTMVRAGCVRGMELDINYEWVTFNLFDHTNPADLSQVTGRRLFQEQQSPPSRYLSPNARDFFMVTVK